MHIRLRATLFFAALATLWPALPALSAPAVEFGRPYHVGAFPLQQHTHGVAIPAAYFDPDDSSILLGARVQTGYLDGYSETSLSGFVPGRRYDLELWQREDRQGTGSDFVQVLVNDAEVGKTFNGYAGWSQYNANGGLEDGRYLRLRYGFTAQAPELRIRIVASHAWWPGPAHGIALALRILGSPVEARIAPVEDGVVPWSLDVKVRPRVFGASPHEDEDRDDGSGEDADDNDDRSGHDGDFGRGRVRVKLGIAKVQQATRSVTLDGSASAGALHYFWELEDEYGRRMPLDNRPVVTVALGPGRYLARLWVENGLHRSEPAEVRFALRAATIEDLMQGPLSLAGLPLQQRRLRGRWLKAELDREAFVAALGGPGEHRVSLGGVGEGEDVVRLLAPRLPGRDRTRPCPLRAPLRFTDYAS